MMNQVILGQDNCDMYNNFTAPSQLNSRAGDETLQNVFTTEPDTAVCGDKSRYLSICIKYGIFRNQDMW